MSAAPLRVVSLRSVTGGLCGCPGCDEPPVTEVTIDDAKTLRACQAHWFGVFQAAYNLTSPLRGRGSLDGPLGVTR